MYSKLVADTKKRNIIEEVNVFDATLEDQLWTCPFCHPDSTVYQLKIPSASETEALRQVRSLIRQHIELHQKDILNQLKDNNAHYEKLRSDSLKRVRLWIKGTVKDRRLYEGHII
ncbi:hypothetical protein BD560DRAFT_435188 [Blakeslea trispora]|nr:hypothetical protein BD560DRAFT_435188 [Blakeslea trispora]